MPKIRVILSFFLDSQEIKVPYLLKAKIKNTGNKAILLDHLYDNKIELRTQDMSTTIVNFYPELEPHYRSCQFGYYKYSLFLEPDLLNPNDYIQLYVYFT